MIAKPTASALELDALRKIYRAHTSTPVTAIDNISLSIAAGQIVGIVGPTRAGKTTLLKLIARLLVPSDGYVRLHSAPDQAAAQAEIGIVLHRLQGCDRQDSVWEILLACGQRANRSREAVATHVERLLGDLDVWTQRTLPITAFAPPLRHALHIACMLVALPSIVLLDEPTRGMNEALAQVVEGWITHQHRATGATVLLSAHNIHGILAICDRALVLYEGRILADLPPTGLLALAQEGWYQICVKGQLDADWSAWFDGLSVTPDGSGNTRLAGIVPDQPALHGLLTKVRDLGLPLLSVTSREAKLQELCAHLWAQE